ncbi:MAG: hypothetical protein F4X17_18450 [Gemmatimonadetes bacterium]|nr:hypothetical protein [Gemmatimonadota bacterium]
MTYTDSEQHEAKETGAKAWDRIMGASLALPGAKVDRGSFLYSQLINYCDETQTKKAIEGRPANAGIPSKLIDRLADACIKSHVRKASAISFGTGLPGGWAVAATIPADLAQFYWHAIVLSQKLAYLYGWPDLLKEDEADEETKAKITLLIGAMMGAQGANKVISGVAERFAREIARRLPRQALTRTAYYPLIKQIGKWIGFNVTKSTFARSVSKVVPIVGGFVSAGLTALMMKPMAKRLKNHLRELRLAYSDDHELDLIDEV